MKPKKEMGIIATYLHTHLCPQQHYPQKPKHKNNLNAHQQMSGKKNLGYIYHLAIIKDEIMPLTATCMDLEIIILSEVSQKDKYYMISLIYGI